MATYKLLVHFVITVRIFIIIAFTQANSLLLHSNPTILTPAAKRVIVRRDDDGDFASPANIYHDQGSRTIDLILGEKVVS